MTNLTSLCNWPPDFPSERSQAVNTSRTTVLSTGAPQGCVLSPLLFTLLTHDCAPSFCGNDETHYRKEVSQLDHVV